jgi:hypothetical protein
MRFLAPAALLSAGLLVSVSAAADNDPGPAAAPPPAAAVSPTALPPAAPALATPPAAPLAPAYPTSLSYGPGYPAPYTMYPPPGAGAPPPYWMPVAGPTERRSDAMRSTGVVLFAAGGLATVVGGVIFAAVATTGCPDLPLDSAPATGPAPAAAREHIRSAHQALNGCDTSPTLGLGIITAGVLTAVAGIPLFVIGSKRVPARTVTGKLAPEVTVGAANASFRWTF